MGKRGPAPAPTALKLVKATRSDRVNDSEPLPVGVAAAPGWLSEAALEIWNEYAADLIRKRVLTAWDCEAFGVWCDVAAKRRQITAQIDDIGMVIEVPVLDKTGNFVGTMWKRNPATLVEKSLTDSMSRYGARFGLTPSDRSQVRVGDVENKGSSADLLSS